MADGLTVNVPEDNEAGAAGADAANNNADADGDGLSLGNNFEEEEDDADRDRAGLNSPKGDLAAPDDEVDGGATPNTLRNQYGVNSPRKKGEIPGGWGAANGDKGGQAGAADAGASGGGGKGLESLVTQVSRDDPAAQIITQVSKDDSAFNTEQEIQKQQDTTSSGGCFAFLCCASSPPPTSTQSDDTGSTTQSMGSKSKPNDPLIPPASGTGGAAGGSNGSKKSGNNTNDEKEESYTETEYPSPGLLPPLLPEHVGKKCLVLDLDETLVHSSFKPIPNPDFIIPVEIDNVVHRVYVMKRPFVDEFLIECAKDYEVVIFTASLAKYADPLLDKLDPHNTITHRLFRESCVLHGTAYVKDLRTLGRKLRNSIIVDNSPPSYLFQPINAIPILSWFDDQTDTQLRDIMPCLKTTLKNIRDVRNILDANTKSYRWLCQQANKDLSVFGE